MVRMRRFHRGVSCGYLAKLAASWVGEPKNLSVEVPVTLDALPAKLSGPHPLAVIRS